MFGHELLTVLIKECNEKQVKMSERGKLKFDEPVDNRRLSVQSGTSIVSEYEGKKSAKYGKPIAGCYV